MSNTPTLTGQDIGQAALATRAVLNVLLAESGTTFPQSVALTLVANAPSAAEQDGLVQQLSHGLKIDRSTALATIDELVAEDLVARSGDPVGLTLTPSGEGRHRAIRHGIDQITERLYGDLPRDDLATAHRILAVVTERANAELTA
jgi:DNA-binding MarR family transcriptional regulator